MFSVSFREGLLLLGILVAFVTGAAVKHWRDAHRINPALPPTNSVAAPR